MGRKKNKLTNNITFIMFHFLLFANRPTDRPFLFDAVDVVVGCVLFVLVFSHFTATSCSSPYTHCYIFDKGD